jgi:hypothetical protein
VEAVLFDFSGTLMRAEPPDRRVVEVLAEVGVSLPDGEVVAKGLSATGRTSATASARVPGPTARPGRLLGHACGRSLSTVLYGEGPTAGEFGKCRRRAAYSQA